MAGIMDELGKAVSKLSDLGGKAVEGAKDLFEKAKPGLEETFEKVSDGAKNLADKAKPVVADALDKMADGAKGLADKARTGAEEAAEKVKDAKEQINDEVKSQVAEIRASQTGTDPIHDYIQSKFIKREETIEEAREEAADALKEVVYDSFYVADDSLNQQLLEAQHNSRQGSKDSGGGQANYKPLKPKPELYSTIKDAYVPNLAYPMLPARPPRSNEVFSPVL